MCVRRRVALTLMGTSHRTPPPVALSISSRQTPVMSDNEPPSLHPTRPSMGAGCGGSPCGRSSDAGSENCSKWLLSHVSAGEAHGVGERSDHSGAGSRSRRVGGTPTPTTMHPPAGTCEEGRSGQRDLFKAHQGTVLNI